MSSDSALHSFTVPGPPIRGTGIGARDAHYKDIIKTKPSVDWLEFHSENFFTAGPAAMETLDQLCDLYPVSLHGVGLSLGSADGLDTAHVDKLAALVERVKPALVSEHLSWSRINGKNVPDLLPLPMIQEALDVVAKNVSDIQNKLSRQILVENPSAYLEFIEQDMTEGEFLAALVDKTGCGLLLDVNNIHVSAHNMEQDSLVWLQSMPHDYVQEIHLAGYHVNIVDGKEFFVDAHNNAVYPPVWDLFEQALKLCGDVPALVEWDNDIPALSRLVAEVETAENIRKKVLGDQYVRAS